MLSLCRTCMKKRIRFYLYSELTRSRAQLFSGLFLVLFSVGCTPKLVGKLDAMDPQASPSQTPSIAVTIAPSPLSYLTPLICNLASPIVAQVPTISGSSLQYSVSPSLPPGLVLNPSVGIITGVPTTVTPPTNYTVTATNLAGSIAAVINIETEIGFRVTTTGDAADLNPGDGLCANFNGDCTLRAAA